MTFSEKEGKAFLNQMEGSQLFTEKGFMSTSMNKAEAIDWATTGTNPVKVLFNIRSKTGVAIDQVSAYPEQMEVLFNKGSNFQIDKVIEGKDYHQIYLTEI